MSSSAENIQAALTAEPAASSEEGSRAFEPVKLGIQRIYLKELSLKIPQAPEIFRDMNQPDAAKPEVSTEIQIRHTPLPDACFEVSLTLRLTAKRENSTVYTLDVQQAVVFETDCKDSAQLEQLLNVYFPSLLYPYAHRVISDTTTSAGFPGILLPPMDFASMYAKRTQKKPNEKSNPSENRRLTKEQTEQETSTTH